MSGIAISSGQLWLLVALLSVAALGLKVLGFVIVGGRETPPMLQRCLALIPASLLAALIAKDTLTTAQALAFDARLVGLAVAAVAVWRRLPFVVVIVLATVSTAVVRALV
jgi:branched-subunit amino acid transport protein